MTVTTLEEESTVEEQSLAGKIGRDLAGKLVIGFVLTAIAAFVGLREQIQRVEELTTKVDVIGLKLDQVATRDELKEVQAETREDIKNAKQDAARAATAYTDRQISSIAVELGKQTTLMGRINETQQALVTEQRRLSEGIQKLELRK